jgi:hypothetical protein
MNIDLDMVIGAFTAFLVAAVPIAVLVTKVTDMVRNLVDPTATRLPKVTWNVVPFVVGAAICVGWGFNPVAALANTVPALADGFNSLDGIAGQLLSGLAVGAMASFWHEKLDEWSQRADLNRAAAHGTLDAKYSNIPRS